MSERTVILHYHLFKNAGTSIDAMLRRNFGKAWVTKEFPAARGNNSAMVAEWIQSEPDAIAFSSHTMLGPIPNVPGVRIITLIMLRDPLARIASAYRFERVQNAQGFGAVLARHTTFEGYVRCRLALPADRQCRNFQTARLASVCPGPDPELERACRGLGRFDVVGRVERFDHALEKIERALRPSFPGFKRETIHRNKSSASVDPIPSELVSLLSENNRQDAALVEYFDRNLDQDDQGQITAAQPSG